MSVIEPANEDEAGILEELRNEMDHLNIVTIVQEVGGLRLEKTNGMTTNDVLAALLRAMIFQVFEEWDMDFDDDEEPEDA